MTIVFLNDSSLLSFLHSSFLLFSNISLTFYLLSFLIFAVIFPTFVFSFTFFCLLFLRKCVFLSSNFYITQPTSSYSHLLSSPLLYTTLLCSTVLYSTTLYCILLYSTLLYSTLLYSTSITPLIPSALSYHYFAIEFSLHENFKDLQTSKNN